MQTRIQCTDMCAVNLSTMAIGACASAEDTQQPVGCLETEKMMAQTKCRKSSVLSSVLLWLHLKYNRLLITS